MIMIGEVKLGNPDELPPHCAHNPQSARKCDASSHGKASEIGVIATRLVSRNEGN
jgi:hypothetical protein